MSNVVETAGDVRIEQPCTGTGRSQCQMQGDDRVHRAPSRSEPIAVRLEACLPLGLQRHLDEHLKGSFADCRNAKGPGPAVRLRDMHPSDRLRSVVPKAQASGQPHPALGRPAHHAVDAGGSPARVLLGHPANREPFCGSGADQELLQVLHLPSPPGRRGTVDPTLQSPHGGLRRSPINVGPRRLPPLAGLFGSHRLTSPAISSSARLPCRRDHGGSQHPFGSGIPSSPRPYPPYYRAAFACSASPLPPPPSPPLRSGYRRLAATGRVGLTLLSNGERRMGRLRPIVRRVIVPPSSRVPIDDPTRVPFWPRPVSTFGRFSMTDLNHGRSLAFSRPSSARPPPDWCSQIVAVVPGASHVGLLLRMSGSQHLGGQGSLTGHSSIEPCGSSGRCAPRQPSGRTPPVQHHGRT